MAAQSDSDRGRPLIDAPPTRWQSFKKVAIPVTLLIIVNTIFSGYVVLTAQALKGSANAVVFAFLRDVGASAILMPACYFTSRTFWPKSEHWGQFILLGGLGVWGAQLLSSLAIKNLTALNYGECMRPSSCRRVIAAWEPCYVLFWETTSCRFLQ